MEKEFEYIRLLDANKSEVNKFISENEYVYRYLPLEYFLDMVHNKQLVFSSPKRWKDPFDSFLFNQRVKNQNTFLNNIFVTCLTLNPHSEAYWKTYGSNGYAIRIRLKTYDLFNLLQRLEIKVWFGRLNYLDEKELVTKLTNTIKLKSALESNEMEDLFLKIFTLKRTPFEYEKEVRIILESSPTKDGLKRIKIGLLNDIINDIYLDPRLKTNEEKALKEYLRQFHINVRQSQLYRAKNVQIQ
ncbi:MAG: DUF2971 domain-containing protein [Saprospiraceae bacterium]